MQVQNVRNDDRKKERSKSGAAEPGRACSVVAFQLFPHVVRPFVVALAHDLFRAHEVNIVASCARLKRGAYQRKHERIP